jgi:hypothetical protein
MIELKAFYREKVDMSDPLNRWLTIGLEAGGEVMFSHNVQLVGVLIDRIHKNIEVVLTDLANWVLVNADALNSKS